jgi:hypothetical protein
MPIMPVFVEHCHFPCPRWGPIVSATSAVYRILENAYDYYGLILSHLPPDATDTRVYGFTHQYIASNKYFFCVALDEADQPKPYTYEENIGDIANEQDAGFFCARVVPPYIDWRILQDWTSACQKTCSPKHKWMNEVPLYLIDCTSRTVIPHSATGLPYRQLDYVALSYVWGKSGSTARPEYISFPFPIPDRCPKTI